MDLINFIKEYGVYYKKERSRSSSYDIWRFDVPNTDIEIKNNFNLEIDESTLFNFKEDVLENYKNNFKLCVINAQEFFNKIILMKKLTNKLKEKNITEKVKKI